MPTIALDKKTVKDWLKTPEGEHWELVRGKLVMTEEIGENSRLAGEIEVEIALFLRQHPFGIVARNLAFQFCGSGPTDKEGVVPDLCYIPNDQLQMWDRRSNVQRRMVPALVAEMLSPSTRKIDLEDKVEIYREARVEEYWIFDLDDETIRIYRFGQNWEKSIVVKSFDDTVTTPLLPGFALPMPEIRRRIGPGQS